MALKKYKPNTSSQRGLVLVDKSELYKGKPFNLKSLNSITNYPGPKYKKVSFSNPGHAHNLSQKLNDMFDCQDFSVIKLTTGEEVEE